MWRAGTLVRASVLLAASTMLACTAGQAGTSLTARSARDVAIRTMDPDARVEGTDYGYDASQGRAWVVLHLMDRSFNTAEGPASAGPRPTVVPGLRYRADTREIVFEEPGADPVVCARVVPTSFLFLKSTKVEQTGNCGVTRVVTAAHAHNPGASGSAERVVYFGRTR